MLRYFHSMKFALNGFFYALRTERNVQIWFVVFILGNALCWWLETSRNEHLFILGMLSLIGACEYLNTAIETLADRVTTEKDEQIKHTKDIAAGATLIVSVATALISFIILLPKIFEKFDLDF